MLKSKIFWVFAPVFLYFAIASSGYSEEKATIPIPDSLQDRVIYYNGFGAANGKAEINKIAAKERLNISHLTKRGILGKGYLSSAGWKDGVFISSKDISPAKALSISVWWALEKDFEPGKVFQVFTLGGKGKNYISSFVRGGGEDKWCALKKPAGIFQVYNFPGIKNINGIYKRDIMKFLNLKAGVWHNTTVTFSTGQDIILYQDGNKVAEYILQGRPLLKKDEIKKVSFGWSNYPMFLDEISICDRVLRPGEIAEYVNMVKGLSYNN